MAALAQRSLVRVARDAMACEFALLFPASDGRAVPKGSAALDEVERLEARLSVYIEDSDLSRLNRTACDTQVPLDPELFRFLELAGDFSAATAGAFDCVTGALIRAWGFFKGPARVPSADEVSAALAASGFRQVQLDPGARMARFLQRGVEINPGGIGKGFAIDRALERIASEYGRRPVLMQGGKSSVCAVGSPPGEAAGWPVGIGDPLRSGRTLAVVHLRDRALGTSACDRQFFTADGRRYGHILDPRTGVPADAVAGATALAPTAAEADALSTAFFVMGVDATREYCRAHRDVAAVLVSKSDAGRPARVYAFGLAPKEVRIL